MGRRERHHNKLTTHHRRPRSRGGKNNEENLVRVNAKQHDSWHRLFSNLNPFYIAKIINNIWIDYRYGMVVVRRKHLDKAIRIAKKLEEREERRGKMK